MDSSAIIKELLSTIEYGSPNDRWIAARKLTSIQKELPKVEISRIYELDNLDIKKAVLYVLGHHRNGNDQLDIILDALSHDDDHIFQSACNAVSELKITTAASLIIKRLNSTSISTIGAALQSLEFAWTESCFESVFNLYKSHKNQKVNKFAAWPLFRNITTQNWLKIFNAFSQSEIDMHRKWCMYYC